MAEQITVSLKCDWADEEDFPTCEERASADSQRSDLEARITLFHLGWRWMEPAKPKTGHQRTINRVFCPKHAAQFEKNGGVTRAQESD